MHALPFADPGVPDTRSPGAFMRWVAARQARTLTAGAVLGTGWMVGQALLPFALGHAIDAGVAHHDAGRLLTWTLVVLALGATVAGAGVGRHRFAVTNFLIASTRTSQLVSRRVSYLGAQTRERWSTGEVATIANADVASVARLFDITARLAGAMIALVLIGVLLLAGSVPLGILVLIGMPVVLVALSLLIRPLEKREAQTRGLLGESSALAADTVLGLRVLRGVGGEAVFFARFAAASQRVRRAGVRAALIQSVLDALQVLLPGLFVVLVTWLGARAALEHKLSAGQLVSYYGYTAFLVAPLQVFTEAAKKGAASYAAARRLVGLLAAERDQPDPPGPVAVLDPGADLRDRDSGLVVSAGLLTGIVCADPAAGHALADRLGGWGAPAAELGGVRLDTVASATVRACVLVADRDPVLLAGTLRETLDVPAGLDPPTRDEALAVADAADVVDSLADGVDGELAERGRNLSGGQRQRVALARALRAAAPVLVLDEPTSAVDAHTEARIGGRLRAARAGRTTVVITTSPLLLAQTDAVIWLPADGPPVRDSHAGLLADAGYRRTVLRSQGSALDAGAAR